MVSGPWPMEPRGIREKTVPTALGNRVKGIISPESRANIASLMAKAAKQPFFKCMAKEAKIRSMAKPREAANRRLIKASIPWCREAGQGLMPMNGAKSHRGSPKNRKLGIHHFPIVSAIKLASTGMGLKKRPMTEPSQREDVAGEMILSS